MSTYSAPGVYVEEVPSAIKPIAGVGTSTAGFVGIGVDLAAEAMPERPTSTMEDRVAILDSARDIKGDNLVLSSDENGIWRPAANPKGYGAFYFPWIQVADPLGGPG